MAEKRAMSYLFKLMRQYEHVSQQHLSADAAQLDTLCTEIEDAALRLYRTTHDTCASEIALRPCDTSAFLFMGQRYQNAYHAFLAQRAPFHAQTQFSRLSIQEAANLQRTHANDLSSHSTEFENLLFHVLKEQSKQNEDFACRVLDYGDCKFIDHTHSMGPHWTVALRGIFKTLRTYLLEAYYDEENNYDDEVEERSRRSNPACNAATIERLSQSNRIDDEEQAMHDLFQLVKAYRQENGGHDNRTCDGTQPPPPNSAVCEACLRLYQTKRNVAAHR